MTLHFWVRNLFARPATRPTRKAYGARPALEALEDRCLLSAFAEAELATSTQILPGLTGAVGADFKYASQPGVPSPDASVLQSIANSINYIGIGETEHLVFAGLGANQLTRVQLIGGDNGSGQGNWAGFFDINANGNFIGTWHAANDGENRQATLATFTAMSDGSGTLDLELIEANNVPIGGGAFAGVAGAIISPADVSTPFAEANLTNSAQILPGLNAIGANFIYSSFQEGTASPGTVNGIPFQDVDWTAGTQSLGGGVTVTTVAPNPSLFEDWANRARFQDTANTIGAPATVSGIPFQYIDWAGGTQPLGGGVTVTPVAPSPSLFEDWVSRDRLQDTSTTISGPDAAVLQVIANSINYIGIGETEHLIFAGLGANQLMRVQLIGGDKGSGLGNWAGYFDITANGNFIGTWHAANDGDNRQATLATFTAMSDGSGTLDVALIEANNVPVGGGAFAGVGGATISPAFASTGLLSPISENRAFKQGSTVLIKWQVSDPSGNPVTSLSAITSLTVSGPSGMTTLYPDDNNSSGNTGLRNDDGQYVYNWNTKGFPIGSYTITVTHDDGGSLSQTIMLATSGAAASLVIDGVTGSAAVGALLAGDLTLYVDNTNGAFTGDELSRIQDAVAGIESLVSPYGANIIVVDDSIGLEANIVLNTGATSELGGVADGVLGVTTTDDEITIIQGWNWYTGTNTGAIGSGQYDFQTVVTHELGHSLGLGHSSDTTSVMYPELGTATARRIMVGADLNTAEEGRGDAGLRSEALFAAGYNPIGKTLDQRALVVGAVGQLVLNFGSSKAPLQQNLVNATPGDDSNFSTPGNEGPIRLPTLIQGKLRRLLVHQDDVDEVIAETLKSSATMAIRRHFRPDTSSGVTELRSHSIVALNSLLQKVEIELATIFSS
jgi:hypothetical protein